MSPVVEERLRKVRQSPASAQQPYPQAPIFAAVWVTLPSNVSPCFPANHCRVDKTAIRGELSTNEFRSRSRLPIQLSTLVGVGGAKYPPLTVDQDGIGMNSTHPRFFPQRGHLGLELHRVPQIILIEKGNKHGI